MELEWISNWPVTWLVEKFPTQNVMYLLFFGILCVIAVGFGVAIICLLLRLFWYIEVRRVDRKVKESSRHFSDPIATAKKVCDEAAKRRKKEMLVEKINEKLKERKAGRIMQMPFGDEEEKD
jgi:uncharacterized membrane protein YcjF (UPF0283 family)